MSRTPDVFGSGWRKSSYSGGNGECVEVATWRKSSHSGLNGNCIEVTTPGPLVAVRDSKYPAGPRLSFPAPAWRAFAASLAGG